MTSSLPSPVVSARNLGCLSASQLPACGPWPNAFRTSSPPAGANVPPSSWVDTRTPSAASTTTPGRLSPARSASVHRSLGVAEGAGGWRTRSSSNVPSPRLEQVTAPFAGFSPTMSAIPLPVVSARKRSPSPDHQPAWPAGRRSGLSVFHPPASWSLPNFSRTSSTLLKEGVASAVGRRAVLSWVSRQDRRLFQWPSGAQDRTRSLMRSGSAGSRSHRWLRALSSYSPRTIRVSSGPGSARSRTVPPAAPSMT